MSLNNIWLRHNKKAKGMFFYETLYYTVVAVFSGVHDQWASRERRAVAELLVSPNKRRLRQIYGFSLTLYVLHWRYWCEQVSSIFDGWHLKVQYCASTWLMWMEINCMLRMTNSKCRVSFNYTSFPFDSTVELQVSVCRCGITVTKVKMLHLYTSFTAVYNARWPTDQH